LALERWAVMTGKTPVLVDDFRQLTSSYRLFLPGVCSARPSVVSLFVARCHLQIEHASLGAR
jgi:hypothetical protein